MSLTVGEDSYISLDEAEIYMVTFGHVEWILAQDKDNEKEIALRKATQFIDTIGVGKWKGRKTFLDQKLAFPRTGATCDNYEFPEKLTQATCEAAVRFFVGENLLEDTIANIASEKVGELQVSYFENKSGQPVYNLIFGLLSDFVKGGNIAGVGTTVHNVTRGFV